VEVEGNEVRMYEGKAVGMNGFFQSNSGIKKQVGKQLNLVWADKVASGED